MCVASSRAERIDFWSRRFAHFSTAMVRGFSAHWLFLANLVFGLYTGLPFLAPILMSAGQERAANLLYTVFRPLCHQLPERSFFLFGERWVYSLGELGQRLADGFVSLRYVGAPGIGYKVAVCERDVAIYGTMFAAGLLFALLRGSLRPLPFRRFLLLALPMAVDGTGQLVGLWTSTWWSRLATGSVFGLACIWLAYPYLEQGMREVHQELAKLAAQETGPR